MAVVMGVKQIRVQLKDEGEPLDYPYYDVIGEDVENHTPYAFSGDGEGNSGPGTDIAFIAADNDVTFDM